MLNVSENISSTTLCTDTGQITLEATITNSDSLIICKVHAIM